MIIIKVRKQFKASEIAQAVDIHIKELPNGFLTSLGSKPLTLIFNHAAASPYGILILAVDSKKEKIIGFILGTVNTSKFYREFFLKYFFSALYYFVPRLLSVHKIKKAFETVCYPKKKETKTKQKCTGELLDLAVEKKFQGQGVATKLFQAFIKECTSLKLECFDIPTTATLQNAHRFYEKHGARLINKINLHGEQQTYIYRYYIKNML